MDTEFISNISCLKYPDKSIKLNEKEEVLNCIELVQSAKGAGSYKSRYSHETSIVNNINPSNINNNNNFSLNNSFNNSYTIQNNINSSLTNNQNIYNFDRVFPEYTNQEHVKKLNLNLFKKFFNKKKFNIKKLT